LSSNVFAIAFDSQGRLYAAGRFLNAGSTVVNRIAMWNGSQWFGLAGGLDGNALSLATRGTDVYVGGSFTNATGLLVNRIAKWNGANWSALGTGMGSGNVSALAFVGSDLYAGGSFTSVNGQSISYIARWDGANWFPVGQTFSNGNVTLLTVIGTNLYAGGTFNGAGGLPINKLARWNGTTWSSVGSGVTNYFNGALGLFSMASAGNDLYIGGAFTITGGKLAVSFGHYNEQTDFDFGISNTRKVGNQFQFHVEAQLIPSYVIEAVSKYGDTWTPLKTNSAGSYDFSEPADAPQRFYRARQQP
jgi:hypothetical protein